MEKKNKETLDDIIDELIDLLKYPCLGQRSDLVPVAGVANYNPLMFQIIKRL